jgi:homoserine O-acetyltransferase/O-succinyltransferase
VRKTFTRVTRGCLIATVLSFAPIAQAHGPNDPPHQLYHIGDLKLETGETINNFSISYVTHGS